MMKNLSGSLYGSVYNLGAWLTGCLQCAFHSNFKHNRENYISDYPRFLDDIRGCLLVFVPSAGEVASALPLLSLLKERHPNVPLLICVTTNSGLTTAKREGLTAVRIVYRGFGFYRKLIEAIVPIGMVVIQVSHIGGLPISLVSAVSSAQKPIVVANGYLPVADMRKANKWFWKKLDGIYTRINMFCMQTSDDAKRLISLGVESDRIVVTGNMKYDAALVSSEQDFPRELAEQIGIEPSDIVFAAGSTHKGEEAAVLQAFKEAGGQGTARIIIAPRSIERAQEVVQLAKSMGFSSALRSNIEGKPDVIVIDTMGELKQIYTLSSFVFVGGTLVPEGGHNVLEPAALGKPVLVGSYTQHTSGAAEMLIKAGGAIRADNPSRLVDSITLLLNGNSEIERAGDRAAKAVKMQSGAVELCANIINEKIINTGTAAKEHQHG